MVHLSVVQQSSSSSTHVGGASSHLQHGAGWLAGIPGLTPLHSHSSPLGHSTPRVSSSRSLAVSSLLTRGSSAHTGSSLLIPKTEKLSPVLLCGADRSSLTGTMLRKHQSHRLVQWEHFPVQTTSLSTCKMAMK